MNAYRPHVPPCPAECEALRSDIVAMAREIGGRAKAVAEEEIDTLLDEAFKHVRGKPA